MKENNKLLKDEVSVLDAEMPQKETDKTEKNNAKDLDYWLMQNIKIMERLTVKEPVAWSEVDWGG